MSCFSILLLGSCKHSAVEFSLFFNLIFKGHELCFCLRLDFKTIHFIRFKDAFVTLIAFKAVENDINRAS